VASFHIDKELVSIKDSQHFMVFHVPIEVVKGDGLLAVIAVEWEGVVWVSPKDPWFSFAYKTSLSTAGFSV